jgi:spermidine synthase
MAARCIYRERNADSRLEIWDEDDRRSLWFDDVILQSEIHRHDPAVLPNPVNRAMLAHLMFEPALERILLAGCGGGAIARWFHARAPAVKGHAVELSPTVARLAREYFDFPPESSHWRLTVGDVRDYLRSSEQSGYDFILVDLEHNQVTPTWVTTTQFLDDCHNNLSACGTLVLNLIKDEERQLSSALVEVRQVFGTELLLLTDPQHDNLLVFAFRGSVPQTPEQPHLQQMGVRWGIDFVTLATRLTRLQPAPPPST